MKFKVGDRVEMTDAAKVAGFNSRATHKSALRGTVVGEGYADDIVRVMRDECTDKSKTVSAYHEKFWQLIARTQGR